MSKYGECLGFAGETSTFNARRIMERKSFDRHTAVRARFDRFIDRALHAALHDANEAISRELPERLVARAIDELGPHPDVLDTRGVILLEEGRGREAIADFNESILQPTAAKYLHLASALASDRQMDAARKAFAEARKLGYSPSRLSFGDRERLKALETLLGL